MMRIITKTQPISIQSWSAEKYAPEGYVKLPNSVDLSNYFLYNGYIKVVHEAGVATELLPDLEGYEAYLASIVPPTPQKQREDAYSTWTTYENGTPYYILALNDKSRSTTALTVDEIRVQLSYYQGDTSEYGTMMYQQYSQAYTQAREDIRARIPD